MRRKTVYLSLVGVMCLAAPGWAQDSVSNNVGSGFPGDAVSPWDTNEQCNDYVVDLVPFETSWGTQVRHCPDRQIQQDQQ